MPKLLLKIVTKDAKIIQQYKDQIKNRDIMDAGFDLYIPDDHMFTKLVTSHVVDHQVQVEYFKDNLPSYVLLLPRSSISKTALRLSNSVGLLDSGYRGNVIAKVDNLGVDRTIDKGTSLFQLLIGENCEIYITEQLSKSKRQAGGFGSTGHTVSEKPV